MLLPLLCYSHEYALGQKHLNTAELQQTKHLSTASFDIRKTHECRLISARPTETLYRILCFIMIAILRDMHNRASSLQLWALYFLSMYLSLL